MVLLRKTLQKTDRCGKPQPERQQHETTTGYIRGFINPLRTVGDPDNAAATLAAGDPLVCASVLILELSIRATASR